LSNGNATNVLYSLNDNKSTVLNEFLNADREAKLIRSAGRLFHKLTTRSEKNWI